MTPSYKELIAVLENSQSVASIGLTEKRVETLLSALRMADALTSDAGVASIVLSIPHQRIADMIACAIDTPQGDWMLSATTYMGSEIDISVLKARYRYSQGEYWSQEKAALICAVEDPDAPDCTKERILTLEDFQRALALMATKDNGAYARHFGDFLGENEDAMTGDLFMQLAVYGEEVFA